MYAKRAVQVVKKNIQPSEKTVVCNLWIPPIVYNAIAGFINKFLIKIQFSKLLSKHNFNSYILWIGTPTAAFVIDLFSPVLTVYNPVDRYSAFPFADKDKITACERNIARKADLIICTSAMIKNDLLLYNANCHLRTFTT